MSFQGEYAAQVLGLGAEREDSRPNETARVTADTKDKFTHVSRTYRHTYINTYIHTDRQMEKTGDEKNLFHLVSPWSDRCCNGTETELWFMYNNKKRPMYPKNFVTFK